MMVGVIVGALPKNRWLIYRPDHVEIITDAAAFQRKIEMLSLDGTMFTMVPEPRAVALLKEHLEKL